MSKHISAIVGVSCLLLALTGTAFANSRDTSVSPIETAPKIGIYQAFRKIDMPQRDLLEQGKQLRTELEEFYRKLVSNGKLKAGPRGTDATGILTQIIPIGTSFYDAQEILRDAGFELSDEPSQSRKNGVLAIIYSFDSSALQKTDLYVYMRPGSPNDYEKISSLQATFIVATP